MFKNTIFIFIIFFFNCLAAKNTSFNIEAETVNCIENTPVVLLQYGCGEIIIANTIIKSNAFNFDNLENLNDGVYSIIINYPSSTFNPRQSVYKFDIIIDKTEKEIDLKFDPEIGNFPLIKKSNINSNYYSYIESENNKINDIEKIEMVLQLQKMKTTNLRTYFNDTIIKIKDELNKSKKEYLERNFNKWSSSLVQNNPSLLVINNTPKSKYWSLFQTNNPDLINTPIFQQIIQKYIIHYYKNPSEEVYKEAFNLIIKQFSENQITKEWVIKYVITGLNHIGNKDLEDYFSERYKYKI